MLRFFRKIRQKLLQKNQFSKYLLYAVGEIVLIVIGIWIAFQINIWTDVQKLKKTEGQSYASLITSLRKDSLELVRIIDMQSKSLAAQNKIIHSPVDQLVDGLTPEELSELLYDVYNGAYSFFPKYGTYNSLVANKGIDIISSESIKSELIDLYDYWCKRYENVDNVVDKKYQNVLNPFLQRELGFFVGSDFQYTTVSDSILITNYRDLQLQCQNVNFLTNHSIIQLKNIQEKVHSLIRQIELQLD